MKAVKISVAKQKIINFIAVFGVLMRRISLIFLLTFFTCQLHSQALFAAPKSSSNQVITTKIKANFIDIKRKSETIFLQGDVIVERQDISILANQMWVYYYEDKKTKDQQSPQNQSLSKSQMIKKIEAQNNVKVFNDEFVATGNSGFYDPQKNIFILEGNVIFNKGTSLAHGEKFIYNLNTKKANLLGQKIDQKNVQNKSDQSSENSPKADNRVIVIIDDADVKNSKKKK